jgi:hypothetical protein
MRNLMLEAFKYMDRGLTNGEVHRKLPGTTPITIWRWSKKREKWKKEASKLFKKGAKDSEVARTIRPLTVKTVRRWRRAHDS